MEYPKLTERLRLAASFVREGAVAADIGTDHAYLPVYLIKKQICPKAFASDIGIGPLESAKRTIREYGAENQVEAVLSDGLAGIQPEAAQDIVITGMGGILISEIISGAAWVKDANVHLILQPMTAVKELREYLYREGFSIQKEDLAKEGDKLYLVMQVSFTGEQMQIDDCFATVGRIPEGDSPYRTDYLKKQLHRIAKRIGGLYISGKNPEERVLLEKTAKQIQNYIDRGV